MREGRGAAWSRGDALKPGLSLIYLPVPLCAFSLSAVHKNRESLLLLSLERKCHRVRASAANFFRKRTVNHTGFTSRWYKTLKQPVRKNANLDSAFSLLLCRQFLMEASASLIAQHKQSVTICQSP